MSPPFLQPHLPADDGMMLLGLPIAVSMVLVGAGAGVVVFGVPFLASTGAMLWGVLNDNLLTAAPLFILLGELLLRSGMADRMYGAGGLAVAAARRAAAHQHRRLRAVRRDLGFVGGHRGDGRHGRAAVAARAQVPDAAALGTLAAGGTLGILIPPSINMIVYGSLTENSIGKLFIAGMIPGLLLTALFMVFVLSAQFCEGRRAARGSCRRSRARAPARAPGAAARHLRHRDGQPVHRGGDRHRVGGARRRRRAVLRLARRTVNRAMLETCFLQTARTTGMIMLILAAAFVLNLLISLSGVAETMTKAVTSLGLSATAMLLVLIAFYLVLGMFMDVMSMLVATVPITYPIVTALGVDPIWFGIFIILMCELALITPPVGMNLFVVQGVRPDKGGIGEVIRGALPYVAIMMAFTLLLMAMPWLATWLPGKNDTEHGGLEHCRAAELARRYRNTGRPRSGRGRRCGARASHREGQSNAQRVDGTPDPHARGSRPVRVLRGSPVAHSDRCARRHSGRRQGQPRHGRASARPGARAAWCAFRSALR